MRPPADASRGALVLALRSSGVRDLDILRAIETIPREDFLPPRLRDLGPRNVAVPIACGQTMPPPLALAQMLEALLVRSTHRVLEIGTGSGYGTAVLARLAREIVSVERYRTLVIDAQARLQRLGIAARIVVGDGLALSAEFGSFDRIVVHGALAAIPHPLAAALAPEGRIVAGVPDGADGPASLASFERRGSSVDSDFICRRFSPIRMSALEPGTPQIL